MSFSTDLNLQYQVSHNTAAVEAYIADKNNSWNLPDLFTTYAEVQVEGSFRDLVDIIKKVVGLPFIKLIPLTSLNYVIEFENFLVNFTLSWSKTNPLERASRALTLYLWGSLDRVYQVHNTFKEEYPLPKSSSVEWYYLVNGSVDSTTMDLAHGNTPHDAYFPWIKSGVSQFQKDYLESSANILLMIGDPGTGKTSFIRDLIYRNNLRSMITYDEDLMKSDSFFASFIGGSRDILVLEDADIIIKDRAEGNKLMSKLLNSSDGLIQTKKKIIMTANLTHLEEVDQALIRPGRCFDALVFRELSRSEARAAAKAAGVPDPECATTLARLFSKGPSTEITSRMGFGSSGI